jgi:excisionase family DNA binding protein
MTFSRALITVEEAVLLTGISRSLLYKSIQSGALPSRVLGSRRRRILLGDLEKFVGAPLNVGQRATA